MASTSERYATAAEGFARVLEGVPADRWDSPTPCEDWTARELVEHAFSVGRDVLGSVGCPHPAPTGTTGPDLALEWRALAEAVLAAADDPEIAGRTGDSPAGSLAFKQLVASVLTHDVLVHTWDLARATGQPEQLDADLVRSAYEKMQPFDEMMRRPGMFGPKVEVPDDADDQARFLAFVGRRA